MNLSLNRADCRFDTFSASPPGRKWMRVTHKPTGITVEGFGASLAEVKEQLMQTLNTELLKRR